MNDKIKLKLGTRVLGLLSGGVHMDIKELDEGVN